MTELNIGDKVGNFQLPDQDEKTVTLSDYSGKWVVLYFYPKDNTPGCTTEAHQFTEIHDKFENKNAVVLGVSPDQPASHIRFIESQKLNLRLLSDMDHQVMTPFGAWGLKKMYGREFEGVIRSTFIIDPDGKLAHKWAKVKVDGHATAVLDKLTELQSA